MLPAWAAAPWPGRPRLCCRAAALWAPCSRPSALASPAAPCALQRTRRAGCRIRIQCRCRILVACHWQLACFISCLPDVCPAGQRGRGGSPGAGSLPHKLQPACLHAPQVRLGTPGTPPTLGRHAEARSRCTKPTAPGLLPARRPSHPSISAAPPAGSTPSGASPPSALPPRLLGSCWRALGPSLRQAQPRLDTCARSPCS